MKKRVLSFILALTMVAAIFGGNAQTLQAAADYEKKPVNVKPILTSDAKKPSKGKYTVAGKDFILAPITSKYSGILWLDYDVTGKGCADIWVLESYEIVDGVVQGIGYSFGECFDGDVVDADGGVPITVGKTYWLYIQNTRRSSVSVNIRGVLYLTGTTRTLSEGTSKWTIASGMTPSAGPTSIYYKIKPSKTGYISVSLKAYGDGKSSGSILLCDKNKRKISSVVGYESGCDGTDGKAYFGVAKGKTYYLLVSNVKDSTFCSYKYGIKYSVYSGKDRIIGTRLTAYKLTRKADPTKTLFKANGKTSTDWYKFNVTSTRKTQIKLDTSRIKSGSIKVTFYKGSKQIGSPDTITSKYNNKIYNITCGPTTGKATKGTYYVKVVKSEKANGLYSIKYVQ